MFYAPHILYLRRTIEPEVDPNGDPVGPAGIEWEMIGRCRCDNNGGGRTVSVNGQAYVYKYHIVIEGNIELGIGTYVQARWPDGRIRGEGAVVTPGMCNLLTYSEVWI